VDRGPAGPSSRAGGRSGPHKRRGDRSLRSHRGGVAARAATSIIPVVFVTTDDPVKFGLVGGLDKPGGNATGVYLVEPYEDVRIRQDLLRQLVPRSQLVALVARRGIPAVYDWREFVEAGGLMSYGGSLENVCERIGVYAGRMLQGQNPADMPVLKPTKFETVINLNTARALGLDIPASVLARADEVIE
jgi:ABC-type uncharacterized transport system substrate-binding protein